MKLAMDRRRAAEVFAPHHDRASAQYILSKPFMDIDGQAVQLDFGDRWPADDRMALWGAVLSIAEELREQPDALPYLEQIALASRVLRWRDWNANSYVQHVSLQPEDLGGVHLRLEPLLPGDVCLYRTVQCGGMPLMSIMLVRDEITLPVLVQDGRIWMALMPSEIASTAPAIRVATGRVLTYGAGLGYFPFMASMKDAVSEVVVVEKNPLIASLFEARILPQFPHREKVKLVRADAFTFLEGVQDGAFDFVFADAWDSSHDYEPWIRSVRACAKFRKTRVENWTEDTILENVRMYAYGRLRAQIVGGPGVVMPNADILDNLLAGVDIASPADIDALMNPASLRILVERGGKAWTHR